ncbi:hypothetical protein OROMI_004187 [Orobanche minor]
MLVSVWIDQHLNFRNNTTNRVESQHAKLKKYLNSAKSSLDKFVGFIDRIVQSQLTTIRESLEKSIIVRIHQHNIQCFKLLRGFVSNEALDIILGERKRWKDLQLDSSNCDCRLRSSCGLPCACELSMYTGKYIPLDSIDIFWRKLDISPSTFVQNDDISCDGELEHSKENFYKQSKVEKKSLLRKLKDIIGRTTTDIQVPRVQKNTRGRPSLKKPQQKRDVHPIHQDSRRSCSVMPSFVGSDSIKEPARHISYVMDLNKEPVVDLNEVPEEFESSYVIDLNEVTDEFESSYNSYIQEKIPNIFRPYITQINDVEGDGNCGFRAVATFLGLSQHHYFQIRMELLNELVMHYNVYKDILGAVDIARLQYSLSLQEPGSVPPDKWMIMPMTGLLIASRFDIVVIFLSESSSTLCLPLWSSPPRSQQYNTGAMALVGNHYVQVELQENSPLPLNHPQ